MDAVPVEAVVEARAACGDADQARAALADALASARAPKRSPKGERWTVTVRVSRTPGTRAAEAIIADDKGGVVAERAFTDRDGKSCAPLVRALGAWATLVIDAELVRAHDPSPAESARSFEADASIAVTTTRAARTVDGSLEDPDRVVGAEPRAGTELGGAMYLRSGFTGSSLTGFSPFVSFEVARNWRLRPSLELGYGTSASEAHLGFNTELCRRIPGNYTDRRGLEADLCALVRTGWTFADPSALGTQYVGVAPVLALRGDIGAGLSGEIRGSVGADYASRVLASSEAQIGISGVLP